MLVEELRSGIDVVVCPGVGASDDHDCVAIGCGGGGVIDTVVIDGRLKEMGVLLEPRAKGQYDELSKVALCISQRGIRESRVIYSKVKSSNDAG